MMDNFVDAALELARGGFRVFPVRGKIPAVKWKEAATTELSEVKKLWDQYPDCNIGIACGNGLVVIDFDDPNDVDARWLMDRLPETRVCLTGRGRHLYYRCQQSGALRNLQLAGVDLRTDGGLVVGPGSVHKNGSRYEWEDPDVPINILPDEVFDYMMAARKKGGAQEVVRVGGKVPAGQRHSWLLAEVWRLACTSNLDKEQLVAVARGDLVNKCDDPESITEVEIEEIVRGAISKRSKFALSLVDLNERGVAEAFLEYWGDTVCCLNNKQWMQFDSGTQEWVSIPDGILLVTPVIDAVLAATVNSVKDNPEALQKVAGFKQTSSTFRFIDSVRRVVTPSCFISEADFQVPEGTLAFQNGLYDMELEQFRGFDAGDHIRETIRADYNPEAECPMWLDTLRYLSGGDEEIVRYFQEVFGFLISSDTIRGIFYLVGVPNSGKNTLVCTLGEVLGNRWVANAPKALIHLSKNDDDEQAARRHLTLVGRRFVWIDETNDKDVIDVQKFKSIASHKTRLTARRLRQDSFDFENTCKVVVMSNYAPKINPDDHAAWSRVVYLPFQFKIPDEVRRADFADDLLSEADGILAWCIEGWLRYKRNGRKFSRPSVVESQVNLWQEETTPLIEFVETQCALDASYECAPAALYRAYESWRERMALGFEGRFGGSGAFTKSLLSHYPDITRRRTKTSRFLKGIAPVEPVVTEVTLG